MGAPKVGPKAGHLRGYINRGGAPKNPNPFLAAPPVRQALGRPRGPSSPDHGASSRTCGYLEAAREEVLATALPASICTTPTRYRSSSTARLVVIP